MPVDSTVGFVGLGTLGNPMARNLVKAGFSTHVFDVREAPMAELQTAGATACASVAELAPRCDVVISMVLDLTQTEAVVFGDAGLISGMRPGTRLVIGSTIGPEPMRRIARAFREKDITVIDAAVSGGYPRAVDGSLTIMVGADEDALAAVQPILQAMGSPIIRTGAVGTGQMAKLANNLVLGINIIGLLEGLELGIRAGISPDILKEVFRRSSANSYPLEMWDELGSRWKSMLARGGGSDIPLCKDLRLAEQFAKDLGVSLVLGADASAIWNGKIAAKYSDPMTQQPPAKAGGLKVAD